MAPAIAPITTEEPHARFNIAASVRAQAWAFCSVGAGARGHMNSDVGFVTTTPFMCMVVLIRSWWLGLGLGFELGLGLEGSH